MRKLVKKQSTKVNTVQAFACGSCTCNCNCTGTFGSSYVYSLNNGTGVGTV